MQSSVVERFRDKSTKVGGWPDSRAPGKMSLNDRLGSHAGNKNKGLGNITFRE